MKMRKLNKVAKVLSKICEVLCWLAEAGMLVALIALTFAKTATENFILSGLDSGNLTIMSTDFPIMDGNGVLSMNALYVALIGGVICIFLVGMMFRNVYLIFKKSELESPFAKDNVRMVREIGIFSIIIPIVQTIAAIVAAILGGGVVNISINPFVVVFGIIMLCLSQFFAYGATLEREVDGLV